MHQMTRIVVMLQSLAENFNNTEFRIYIGPNMTNFDSHPIVL